MSLHFKTNSLFFNYINIKKERKKEINTHIEMQIITKTIIIIITFILFQYNKFIIFFLMIYINNHIKIEIQENKKTMNDNLIN